MGHFGAYLGDYRADLGDVWLDLSSTWTSDQNKLDFIVIYNVLGWKSSVDMLAYAGKCWHMLASAGICWQVLASAGICWHMLGGPAEWVVAL